MATRKIKPEELLAKRLSGYLLQHWPEIPFRFDLFADSGVSMGEAKKKHALHGKWSRGHPDLTIFGAGGKPLFLELKATRTVPNTEHTRRQAAYHAHLKSLGYKVSFCCGYEECQKKIEKYLRKKEKKARKSKS